MLNCITVTELVQLSDAVGGTGIGGAGKHSTVIFAGGLLKVGAVLSVTEIVRLQDEVLPQASVAVQVRRTLNSWRQMPLGVVTSTEEIIGVPPHASMAVAAGNVGTAGHSMEAVTVGQMITGPVLSVTAMVRLQVEVFPQASVAVQVRCTLNS